MQDVANKIVSKWKEIIESYSIKVESVSCFRMDKYYTGYPEIEYCYKVNFDFGLNPDYGMNYWEKNKRDRLMKELFDKQKGTEYNYVETKFHNEHSIPNKDKVDYFTNQGHRIIIQFYPQGFIDELREDKLNQLGI